MFGFENLLMQVATDTGSAALNSVVSIVVSVGVIAGIFAPLLKKFGGRLNVVGQYADTFSQKTAENQEEFAGALKAIRTIIPEVDSELKKHEVGLAKVENRAMTAAEQLEFFRNLLKEKEKAASVTDLPRENFTVNIKKKRTFRDADAV